MKNNDFYFTPLTEAYFTIYSLISRDPKFYLLEKKMRRKKVPVKKRAVKLVEAALANMSPSSALIWEEEKKMTPQERLDVLKTKYNAIIERVKERIYRHLLAKEKYDPRDPHFASYAGRVRAAAYLEAWKHAAMVARGESSPFITEAEKVELDEARKHILTLETLLKVSNKFKVATEFYRWLWEKIKNIGLRIRNVKLRERIAAAYEVAKKYLVGEKKSITLIILGISTALTILVLLVEPLRRFVASILRKIKEFFSKSISYIVTYIGSFFTWIKSLFGKAEATEGGETEGAEGMGGMEGIEGMEEREAKIEAILMAYNL